MVNVPVVVGDRISAASSRSIGGEAKLFPVGSAHAVGGVGTHIVGGAGDKVAHAALDSSRTGAVVGMAVADGGVGCRTPADASSREDRSACCCHKTDTGGSGGHHTVDLQRIHDRCNSYGTIYLGLIENATYRSWISM